MTRVLRALAVLRRRGPGYLAYLVRGVLWPRWVLGVLAGSRAARWWARRPARAQTPEPLTGSVPADAFVDAQRWLPAETLDAARAPSTQDTPDGASDYAIVLGRIDNDGRLLSLQGPVPDFDPVDPDDFVPRYRFDLDLVLTACDERWVVVVRKDFRGDRGAFERERAALTRLAGRHAPTVLRADADHVRLEKALLSGPTLRQVLVEAGAKILSVDTESDPELEGLDSVRRIEAVWARGRAFLETLPDDPIGLLEKELDAIHRAGVTGFGLTFGNVVLEGPSRRPRFLDFDAASTHAGPEGLRFELARDLDRQLFARIYGADLPTLATAREQLERVATAYAPVDLGLGYATRGFWSVDSGTGRWEFLNAGVLRGRIEGRRILDLGSFNALNPLLMLASGAAEVVAVERSAEMIPVARDLQRLFEWRGMRRYALDLRCADMRAVLDEDWGSFDLVTAFCSLYYLDEDDMARVVRRAAELAPTIVLQAKTDTRPEAGHDKAHKSSLSFLRALLEENGFPEVEIAAPPGYSRPLLIGSRRRSR